jgi:hypothetical protein
LTDSECVEGPSSLQSYLPSFRYWIEVQCPLGYTATHPASDTGQRYTIIQPTELLAQLQILDRGTVQGPLDYVALTHFQILDRGTVPTRLHSYLPSFRYWTEVQCLSYLPSFRYWTEVQCPLDYTATCPASDTGQRYSAH